MKNTGRLCALTLALALCAARPCAAEPMEAEPPITLTSPSAILTEPATGRVIFEKNADQIMYPASTTKIMTALLAIMCGDLDMTCTVSAEAVTFYEDDVTTADLREGEELTLRDLLYATLVQSANDAANAVAEAVSGSIS